MKLVPLPDNIPRECALEAAQCMIDQCEIILFSVDKEIAITHRQSDNFLKAVQMRPRDYVFAHQMGQVNHIIKKQRKTLETRRDECLEALRLATELKEVLNV